MKKLKIKFDIKSNETELKDIELKVDEIKKSKTIVKEVKRGRKNRKTIF
jgi:hypothetical protein